MIVSVQIAQRQDNPGAVYNDSQRDRAPDCSVFPRNEMTSLRIFVCAIALLATSVVSAKVAPEVLDILNEELQDLDFPEAFNLTSFDLDVKADHPHAHLNVVSNI